jgi:hypothetical protein
MKCAHCGRHASPRSKFCEHCGQPLIPKRTTPSQPTNALNWPLLIGVLLGGVLIGAIVMYVGRGTTQTQASLANNFDPKLRGPQLATAFPEVYQVAAEFTCPCGTCTDGLEVCDCEMVKGASEVRQFIYDNLSAGHHPPHVIEMVEAKYGYRKTAGPALKFENLPPAGATK